jgi:ferredoxin
LQEPLKPALLIDGAVSARARDGVTTFSAPAGSYRIEGHLGQFRITGEDEALAELTKERFDLVLDLHPESLRSEPLAPPGYFRTRAEEPALEEVLAELPDMVGEFEKPRFFDYDPDICAHGRSGIGACSRCLDACPAGAISSLLDLERIEVDPNLCQGGGICASVCPTGAIRYVFPSVKDQLERVGRGLKAFREAGGSDPILLLHAQAATPERLSGNLIPLPLEELGSAGLDIWLSSLAYGARAVWLYRDPGLLPEVERGLEQQRVFAAALVEGLGGQPEAIRWVDPSDPVLTEGATKGLMPEIEAARYAALGGKRTVSYLALDHLAQQLETPVERSVPLPRGAPFGRIQVDRDKCTLCMGCVSVCPAKALADGGEEPVLSFYEQNCVQCGLCESACPERAITLEARFAVDPELRARRTTLNEEPVFRCVRCGKPFATQKMIDTITAKLSGHHMFQDSDSLRRLKMCDDCRVRDMFESGGIA